MATSCDNPNGPFGLTRETSNAKGTSGDIHFEEKGVWNGASGIFEYKGSEDSSNKVKMFKEIEAEKNIKYNITIEIKTTNE